MLSLPLVCSGYKKIFVVKLFLNIHFGKGTSYNFYLHDNYYFHFDGPENVGENYATLNYYSCTNLCSYV